LSLPAAWLLQREGEQAGGSRKRRPPVESASPASRNGPPDADFLVEDRRRDFGHAVELTGAADDDGATAGQLIHTAGLEPAAHQLEGLLDARPDDADQDRARMWLGRVRSSSPISGTSMMSYSSLGLATARPIWVFMRSAWAKRRRQAAGDVAGDVLAADRDAVDMHEMALR
jgi:hypothetical protein